MDTRPTLSCLLRPKPETRLFQPQAEDILGDEELLDLFRIIKQIIRRRPDTERIAKLLFCISYSLGDLVKFYRPAHDDTIIFRDDLNPGASLGAVRVNHSPSCCDLCPTPPPSHSTSTTQNEIYTMGQRWKDLGNNGTTYPKQLSVSYLTRSSPTTTSSTLPSSDVQQRTSSLTGQADVLDNITNTHPLQHSTSNGSTVPLSSPSVSLLDHTPPPSLQNDVIMNSDQTSGVRPYTQFRTLYSTNLSSHSSSSIRLDERHPPVEYTQQHINDDVSTVIPSGTNSSSSPPSKHLTYNEEYQPLNSMLHGPMTSTRIQPDPSSNQVMEPRQRGFYYQYGRIEREPPLLRRFAEQGVLTQASLLRKRRRQCSDSDNPYVLTTLPAPTKKPKIPHRHGEFEQRRDDIIQRMRSITLADLEQKSIRLAPDITLAIEQAEPPSSLQLASMTPEDAAELLEPALRILTFHSNMKPHLDNGMNQNGIYYNIDYYRLYLAFIQFQKVFATLFPQEVVKIRNLPRGDNNDDDDDEYDPLAIPSPPSNHAASVSAMSERDRDRDRNMNMKAYRGWLEPLLTETNWAAFRRNIVVGERMVLLTKVVGQGVLLMTKELSGSKLHLTFTNSEWDEFIGGLHLGKWDDTVTWDEEEEEEEEDTGKSRLVEELKNKFLSEFWFHPDGTVVSPSARKLAQERRKQQKEDHSISDAPTATSSTSSMDTTAGQITLSSPTSLPRMHSLDK